MSTIGQILSNADPKALAFRAPDTAALNYGGLTELVARIGGTLRAAGLQRTARVAIVLPNGAQMATAFLAVANACIAAPLNPSYKVDEFKFYIEDLRSQLLITDDANGPAAMAAKALNVPIALVSSNNVDPAGIFNLSLADGTPLSLEDASAEDEALVLHTSGTTSRPKIVPLSQENVTASAANIAASLSLTPADTCMNIMPLFHIHGLIAAVLSSLHAGASIYCTPGFNALKVYSWMQDAAPTWYTAVPTMHQAILSRAGRNADVIADVPLRFLRSSSASLPAQVMEQLNKTFNAPVIEAYGMTEAAHQMCCNPLDRQKPGSVGVAAGPEVAIAHEIENRIVGGTGEVVISGPNVTPGYESTPEANEKNFFECEGTRWFRTGDQGAFDADGFLELTGRLKEIINRGGEKISPLEVDGVLMDHPSIQQVVTFALPHPKLGEEVAAAAVLREGHEATEKSIREFAAERMADFKVPRRVIIMDEIPKGATGKMQRIGMAEKLGLVAAE